MPRKIFAQIATMKKNRETIDPTILDLKKKFAARAMEILSKALKDGKISQAPITRDIRRIK